MRSEDKALLGRILAAQREVGAARAAVQQESASHRLAAVGGIRALTKRQYEAEKQAILARLRAATRA